MWREAASLELQDNVRSLAPLDQFKWAQAHIHFARAVGASRDSDVARAREELANLMALEQSMVVPAGSYDWRTQVSIERQIAHAWIALAEGQDDEAVRLTRAAAELDDTTEKHPVTPGAILPAREQLGELLIELDQPRSALVEYEAALKRAPRRLASLYGATRAAKLAGDMARAQTYFSQLVDLTTSGDESRQEVQEAKAFAAGIASR